MPLTRERTKPAVPFGGQYRLIDLVLSNLVNTGLRKIVVLTQYLSPQPRPASGPNLRLSPLLGNYVVTVPAQMRTGPHWFAGSADAIYQNLNILGDERPDYVAVFGADHIYRMDVAPMIEQHIASGAGITVAAIPVPIEEASAFGVIDAGADGKIRSFVEKPPEPPPCRMTRTAHSRRWATTSSPPTSCDAWSAPTARGRISRFRPRHRQEHHSGASRVGRSLGPMTSGRIRFPANAPASAVTGGTSAASTPTTRRRWTWWRSTRSSISTTTSGRF